MWCGRVSCGVVWCHVVWCGVVGHRAIGLPVRLVEWCAGCLAAWVICWVFGWLGHDVWCLHPVVCGAVCRFMLCDVMSVATHVITTHPREAGGLISRYYFCSSGVLGNCSSGALAASRTPLERRYNKNSNCLSAPRPPWNGSNHMCTHTHDITEHTTAYSTTHHRVQTPHNMPQPAKHPTNNPSCQTTQPAKQPTHRSTNHRGNPIARYPTPPHHTA